METLGGRDYMNSKLLEWAQSIQLFLADQDINSLNHLILFSTGLFCLFIGLHIFKNLKAKRSRRNIAISIGGWGSRGKSGTERLKAALFNSMGLSLISKTSGCEPVLLYSQVGGDLEEVPLFRPFDKATIWEQTAVLDIANKLDVDVFLWECMGLEPDYVEIMQRDWMNDEICTITNTYPDHEDVQGPSGLDVATSISHFIGRNSRLLTSEEIMFPVLEQRSKKLGGSITKTRQSVLNALTDDVMALFPYEEHPANVSLVMELANEFGVDGDFALREMTRRVKADIGVLRTYPTICWPESSLQFSNGFSANEKFGCLSNWQRLGLSTMTPESHPKNWLTVLVNNREDRVPRSQVFAKMLVVDLQVDEFYLMGTNQEGFAECYRNNVRDFVDNLDLSSSKAMLLAIDKLRLRLRIPKTERELRDRFGKDPQGTKFERLLRSVKQLADFEHNGDTPKATKKLREFIVNQFLGKMIKVPQLNKPDDLPGFIFRQTPSFMTNVMHGVQNIKGPGMQWLELMEIWLRYYENFTEMNTNPVKVPSGFFDSRHRRQYMDNIFCYAHYASLVKEDEDNDVYEEVCSHLSSRLSGKNQIEDDKIKNPETINAVQRMMAYARFNLLKPLKEYQKVRRVKKVYKLFSNGTLSATKTREEIRLIQNMV